MLSRNVHLARECRMVALACDPRDFESTDVSRLDGDEFSRCAKDKEIPLLVSMLELNLVASWNARAAFREDLHAKGTNHVAQQETVASPFRESTQDGRQNPSRLDGRRYSQVA
jgi:hypothetical protein